MNPLGRLDWARIGLSIDTRSGVLYAHAVDGSNRLTVWQRCVRTPQKLWLRRALFQVHLWSGIILGLYILMISVTGSVVVYANELYRATTPRPIISTGTGPRLSDEELTAIAVKAYPGFKVVNVGRPRDPDQAIDIWMRNGEAAKKRLFDVRTGADLGDSVAPGIRFVSKLIDLHDNLLAGPEGRKVNGLGALALLLLTATGVVIWWPGAKTWRRSLIVPRRIGWKRWTWHLHSFVGFWSLGFLVIFVVSGIYLSLPQPFQDFADKLEPLTPQNAGERVGDKIIYWLAFLHFGRINGIGIPCNGPGFCDQATKAVWAFFGLAPAVLFVTGAIMWWYRVLRPGRKALSRPSRAQAVTVS